MREVSYSFFAIILGYNLGALPMGYFMIALFKRQDLTRLGSGRTGGTNAMRAGGLLLGLLTSILDLSKGYLAVISAIWLVPGNIWVHVLGGAAAVFGHNWSFWLYIITGKLSAGAGTGPNIGVAIAFWHPIVFMLVPIVAFFVLVVGFASVASLVVAVCIPIIFGVCYLIGISDLQYQYIIYGLITAVFVVWALRPNIVNLIKGNEKRVGLFAHKIE